MGQKKGKNRPLVPESKKPSRGEGGKKHQALDLSGVGPTKKGSVSLLTGELKDTGKKSAIWGRDKSRKKEAETRGEAGGETQSIATSLVYTAGH